MKKIEEENMSYDPSGRNDEQRILTVKNASRKMNVFLKNFSRHSEEDNAIHLSHIVKKFVSSLMKIDYNLSYEEMKGKIKESKENPHLKEQLTNILDRLDALEFEGVKITKQDVLECANQFINTIKFVEVNTNKNRSSTLTVLIRKIRKWFGLEKLAKEREEDAIQELYELLVEGHKLISSGKKGEASLQYLKIKKIYSHLSAESKKRVYPDVIYYYKKIVGTATD
ncbi:MAG: hypothetical protein QXW00_00255 [Candidatus Woesearchaeota archaeon]